MGDRRLDGLLRADTLEEILKLLSPTEVIVAVLRVEGTSDEEIATILGVERSTVTVWMIQARKRIAREMPEAAGWLEGRQRRVGRAKRLHRDAPEDQTSNVAEEIGEG